METSRRLYDQYLQPDWRERYPEAKTWDLIQDIPGPGVVGSAPAAQTPADCVRARAHGEIRASRVKRERQRFDVWPKYWTLTRSRSALHGDSRLISALRYCSAMSRVLRNLLTNPDMPVQIVIAGKAHPKDHPGKTLIREIVQLSRDPSLSKRLVFLEDYGIEVARDMVQGVDVWLNNPRRGEEACGTSGMKASINGVLNLSILDGWFDEAYEYSGGWAIGDREPYSEDQDEYHASAIYSLLENETRADVSFRRRRWRAVRVGKKDETVPSCLSVHSLTVSGWSLSTCRNYTCRPIGRTTKFAVVISSWLATRSAGSRT